MPTAYACLARAMPTAYARAPSSLFAIAPCPILPFLLSLIVSSQRPFSVLHPSRFLPPCFVILGATAMVGIAHASHHLELMLPSFGALMTGTWLVDENLWHYSKRTLLLCVPSAATIGTLIAALGASYSYTIVYPSLYLAFLATASLLILTRSQIYPCFGAAALPILFRTTSPAYPLSILTLTLLLILGRTCLEHAHLRSPLPHSKFPQSRRKRALYYLQISLGLIPALLFAAIADNHFLILPPLFVTYASFCNAHASFTQYPLQTWLQILLAITVGMLFCTLAQSLSFNASLPAEPLLAAIAAALTVSTMLFIGKCFHRLFPPAMSFALTPFLIGSLPLLVLFVACMTAYFIAIAHLMRKHPAYQNEDLHYL